MATATKTETATTRKWPQLVLLMAISNAINTCTAHETISSNQFLLFLPFRRTASTSSLPRRTSSSPSPPPLPPSSRQSRQSGRSPISTFLHCPTIPSSRISHPPAKCLHRLDSNQTKKISRSLYKLKTSFADMDISTADDAIPTTQDGLQQTNHYFHRRDELNKVTNNEKPLITWKDSVPLALYTAICLIGAILVSTYEDLDVTYVRPNPSTLRRPAFPTAMASTPTPTAGLESRPSWRSQFNFIGAATRGMGWGSSERGMDSQNSNNLQNYQNSPDSTASTASPSLEAFRDWYGESAVTLQWKPSYNEIMLRHRLERVPRWESLEGSDDGPTSGEEARRNSETRIREATSVISPRGSMSKMANVKPTPPTKEELQRSVKQLYRSLDELDELKLMADDYMWEEMKERLAPISINAESSTDYSGAVSQRSSTSSMALPMVFEYSMDILKAAPSYYSSLSSTDNHDKRSNDPNKNDMELIKELPTTIGFDWGSCAWRHCGAKADAQEAWAELYSSMGMLEPFECRFIIDIIERSIRDVLAVVPDELRPSNHGTPMQPKPYVPYVSQGDKEEEGMGIDYEYVQALSALRVDMSEEE